MKQNETKEPQKTENLSAEIKEQYLDGEMFAKEAIGLGAYVISEQSQKNTLTVESTAKALMDFAGHMKGCLKKLKGTVAVTGSVGKTTTKEFIKCIVGETIITHATEGNYNNKLGVPMTLLKAKPDTELLVLELGMNSPGEIAELSKCVMPDIGVITCIGTSHIGRLGSREAIANAKLEILCGMSNGRLIIPYGEPLLEGVWDSFSFSLFDSPSDVIVTRENGLVRVSIKDEEPFSAAFAPLGKHNLHCLGAAVSASYLLGIDLNTIKSGISRISAVNTRQSVIRVGDFFVLDDSYNASLESMLAAFELLFEYEGYKSKSIVIGDILELGDKSERIYRKIGESILKYNFRAVFPVGECSTIISQTLIDGGYPQDNIHINPDAADLGVTAEQIINNRIVGELMLIKASHAIRFDALIGILKNSLEGKDE